MPVNNSFIADAEEIVDEVAEWGAEYVDRVVEALSPDGRPFGMEKRNDEELIKDYVTNLRGNPDAWANRIRTMVAKGQQRLQQAGLTQDQIAGVHLYDVVERLNIEYSVQMERKIQQKQRKLRKANEVPVAEAPDGSPPELEVEVEPEDGGYI